MIYDASNEIDVFNARNALKILISQKAQFRITRKRKKRSYKQNAYLHLILTYFAQQYGETMEYVKQYFFKELVNPDIFKTTFTNRKTGEKRISYRSTTDLNTKELTTTIENFRNYSAKEAGIYLPAPEDTALINALEYEVEKFKQH